MYIDDLPEISYQELNTLAVELFEPADDPMEYLLAAEAGFAADQFEKYTLIQLGDLKTKVIDAYCFLPMEVSGFEKTSDLLHRIRLQEEKIRIKEIGEYTLEDFVKNPLKNISFKSSWNEIQEDLDFSHLFSGKRKLLKTNLLIFASFGLVSLPHELIHAGVNYVSGGINKHIVLNTFYGAPLWETVIPGIESKLMIPLIGGYVDYENPSTIGSLGVIMAPYVLTPLGIYLMKRGKDAKSIAICAGGAGLIGLHLGGIIGDWRVAGTKIVTESIGLVQDALEVKPRIEYKIAANITAALCGVYLGSKLLAVSYRAGKATVNSVRNYAKKK